MRDPKGRFEVKREERDAKFDALTALMARVGVRITPTPVQTVHIDLDLNAPDAEQQEARAVAEGNVRKACETMGADPEEGLRKLAAVFAALPSAQTVTGQEAAAALSASVDEQSGTANVQCPLPPEAFHCRHRFSKVLAVVPLHSKCARALTLENVCYALQR